MTGAAPTQVGEAAQVVGRPIVLALPGRSFEGARVFAPEPVSVGEVFSGDLDDSVHNAATEFGGLNPFGQPNYRLVWGYQRGHWIGDSYHLKYVDRHRHRERWHLEKWAPASDFGTPEQWYASAMVDFGGRMVNVLGPYPAQGDYVRVVVFENYFTSEYVRPLESLVVEAIVRNRQHAEQSRLEIRRKIQNDIAATQRAADAQMDEVMGSREAAFPFKNWMPMSGPMTPEARRRDRWDPTSH